jgi:hypothetical protein
MREKDEREDERELDEEDELEELKSRRSSRSSRRSHRAAAEPVIASFTVMYDFGKFYATVEYKAPDGWTSEDVEEYIFTLKDSGEPIYKPRKSQPTRRQSRGRSNRYDD